MVVKKAAELTLKQLSKLGRTQKNKRPNDVAVRVSRDETGARPMRYFDRDSPHVKIKKHKGVNKYVANTVPKPKGTHYYVGNVKVPREHTEHIPGRKRRTIKDEYKPLYTDYYARQLIDIPIIKNLYSKYGDYEFMGRPMGMDRLTNPLLARLINKERTKKGYGPISVATQPSGTLSGTIKAAVPDFPLRTNLNRYPLTRGRVKKEIDVENYLKEIDPVTKQPRYLTTHTRDMAKDPRFSSLSPQGIPSVNEAIISRIRKAHNPPLEKTISRYGTPKGTDITTSSVSPTGRLRQAVDHFTQAKSRQSQKFTLIKSRRKKREQQLNNIVLSNLTPELKKTAEGLLKHGRTFMQALHETFSMHRSPEMAKALSTWVRNMKHSTAEFNVRKLRKMRKETTDPDRRWEIEFELAGWDDDMRAIGVQSNIDDVIYGKWYDQSKSFIRPLVEDLPRQYPTKQMKFLNPETQKMEKIKFSGMNEGGIVNGYAGGGLIKKLLGESLGMMSRRKFMKGVGATAAASAIPKSAMKLAAPAAKKAALSFAPPWVNGMLSALKDVPITAKTVFRMGNNSQVQKLGSKKIKLYGGETGTESHYRIKTSDQVKAEELVPKSKGGDEWWDDVVLTEEPGQTTITWKNKAYDHGNDQHVVIDKINKETRFVDDNWHMEAGGEDIAKDDWIEYPFTTNKSQLERELGILKGDADDMMVDYASVDGMDNSYSNIFESFVDSFSPSGNVFGTVGKMKNMLSKSSITKKYKKEIDQMQKTIDEDAMMKWEDQFRGGKGIHGYYRGGTSMRDYKPQVDESRRTIKLKNMSDVEALARMMYAESSPGGGGNFRDAQAIGHVIQNRASYKGPDTTYGLQGYENYSPIKRVIAGQGQFTPFRSEKNLNFWDFDMTEKHPYYQYAAEILRGNVEDFTGGATMFDKDPNKYNRIVGPPGRGYTESIDDPYWNYSPSQFEHGGPHSFWGITPRMNKGGMAEKFSVDDAVAMIRANPQSFAGGGIVMKFAPKVLGKLTQYATRARPAKARMYKPPKGPYTLTDESGVRILDRDFQTLEGAQLALDDLAKLRTQDASTFKIFGKRPPKTKEGVSEPAPEVDLGMVGKKIKIAKGTKYGDPDQPGAIFWGSREKIIASPQEGMTGQQWLDYLMGMKPQAVFKEAETNLRMVMAEGKGIRENFGGLMKMHRGNSSHPDVIAASKLLQAHKLKVKQANDTLARLKLEQRASAGVTDETRRVSQELPAIRHEELNDTSLAPLLSQYKNKIIPKKVLADAFDRIAPKMDVEVAGREIGGEMMEKLSKSLAKIDPQAYRDQKQAGFFRLLKSAEEQLNRGLKEGAEPFFRTEADSILKSVDNYIFDNYGVANALDAGVPKNFPFDMKKMVAQLSSAAGKRTAGLKEYAGKPQFAGTQTLGGGENPRELLFRYTPGSMRKGEPVYKYAHDFRMPDKAGENAFVHMRMTDRTDELGNRILFIEEIQSDMHQPINAAKRVASKALQRGETVNPQTLMHSRYAPRGDVPLPVSASDKVNEEQFKLIVAKIDDLASQPQTVATQKRIAKLNRERTRIRKIIDESKKKATPATTKIPQGPYSKTEDYNEFVIKYATKMAQEGGYDGVAVATSAIKNRGLRPTDQSFHGNLVAYGPMVKDALRKVSKKSGAKIIETSIIDDKGVGWKVPMIYLKGNNEALFKISKGLPAYRRGGIAAHGRQ